MKKVHAVFLSLGILALAVMPVHAFTAESLTITLADNGDAEMEMQYELSFPEKTAVFLRFADPAAELKNAFGSHTSADVTVPKATDSSAVVLIPSFAERSSEGDKTTLITPALSFERARQVMDEYWFAPLISPDFSPCVTTVIFPDGHRDIYYEALTVPSVSYILER